MLSSELQFAERMRQCALEATDLTPCEKEAVLLMVDVQLRVWANRG